MAETLTGANQAMLIAFFWISVATIVYVLVVFPIVLMVRSRVCHQPVQCKDHFPALSVIIAVYNEQSAIVKRIINVLKCDYPRQQLEILIASDGSTDDTAQLVRDFNQQDVKLFEYTRRGKSQVINATVSHARGEILVFTDANTEFRWDALREITRPFSDPAVGGVAGNQIYQRDDTLSLSADGELAYWTLDTRMKIAQSAGGSATSATGAFYAIRKSLFEAVPSDCMDDFMISTGVIDQGFRLVFEPGAVAFEPVATRSGDEFRRKIRVITQGLRSVIHRRSLLNPLVHGFYSVQLLTHKVLRRVLVIPLMGIFVTAPVLWNAGLPYQIATVLQVVLVALALIGWVLSRTNRWQSKLFSIPYYYFLVNLAALIAIGNTVIGRRIRRWEPERHGVSEVPANSQVNQTTVS